MRNEKCYKHKPTRPGTPLDTADAMVNSPGHVGVGFAEIGTGLCETDVRRFQRSFRPPKYLIESGVAPPGPVYRFERTEEPLS